MTLTGPCPPGMRARFSKKPAGLEPARGRASSGRAASAASRRGRRQAAEADADLRSKYADVPPPLPHDAYEPVSLGDAGSFPLDAGGARTREGASVKRTRSVRSEPARAPAGVATKQLIWDRARKTTHIESRTVPSCRQKRNVPKCRLLSCGGIVPVLAVYPPL